MLGGATGFQKISANSGAEVFLQIHLGGAERSFWMPAALKLWLVS